MVRDIYKLCAQLRAEGIPMWVRYENTSARESRFFIYYGYAPAIASGLTKEEAIIVINAAAMIHRKLRAEAA